METNPGSAPALLRDRGACSAPARQASLAAVGREPGGLGLGSIFGCPGGAVCERGEEVGGRGELCAASGEGLGVGRWPLCITRYRLQRSQEPGNITLRCVPGAGPALPSRRVCSVSGSVCAIDRRIKLHLQLGTWHSVRNSLLGELCVDWDVCLLSPFSYWKLARHRKELCNDGWVNEIRLFLEGTALVERCQHFFLCLGWDQSNQRAQYLFMCVGEGG